VCLISERLAEGTLERVISIAQGMVLKVVDMGIDHLAGEPGEGGSSEEVSLPEVVIYLRSIRGHKYLIRKTSSIDPVGDAEFGLWKYERV
jgi:hypothetical protein